ncbi:MAG: signal recognition particle subunit SRP19/SEC65 family protein [Candidatus Bathyarchaeota archaeon]
MRKQKKTVLWPVYFDSMKTRKLGRKVPKELAIASPKILEIKEALGKIGLDCELILDASHPQTLKKNGMLTVEKLEPKNELIKKIAKNLVEIRKSAPRK